jgi:hypothetical protein
MPTHPASKATWMHRTEGSRPHPLAASAAATARHFTP